MTREFTTLPLKKIAAWGFGLNALWEFGQCFFLYDMWDWGFWRATAWMWGAIFGDVFIVLGIAFVASVLVGAGQLDPLMQRGWIALLLVGFGAAVLLEWGAQALHLWEYSNLMPMVEVLGYTVGLSPVAQIAVLPALSVHLAVRKGSA